MSTTAELLAKLREPFSPEQIGHIPRGNTMLDYVGHAHTTERLLDVDPGWTWEPVSFEADGQPCLVRDANGNPRGLWIKLTVCGVTRYGYGSCDAGKPEPVKELIGDALRNAAMRFGVALDLWMKEDTQARSATPTGGTKSPAAAPKPTASDGRAPANGELTGERKLIADELDAMPEDTKAKWLEERGYAKLTRGMLKALPDEKVEELWQALPVPF